MTNIILPIHLIGVLLGLGGAVLSDILFITFAFNKNITLKQVNIIDKMSKVVTLGLTILLISGFFLFFQEKEYYINNSMFLTKMFAVFVLSINGFLLHKYIFKNLYLDNFLTDKKYLNYRKLAFAFGSVSFISWITAFFLAKTFQSYEIAYSILIYLLLLFIGICFSQFLSYLYEKKI